MSLPIAELPLTKTGDGHIRRVGIEVECGGVTEDRIAQAIVSRFGGEVTRTAEYDRSVTGTSLGDMEILLDTALRTTATGALAKAGLNLGRAVIPVEFVTAPIEPAKIAQIDALCRDLRQAGAVGTSDGIVLGFGVHLNVALTGTGVGDILPTLRAFALVEDWLRHRLGIDLARRVQPFVAPYPAAMLDALTDPGIDWSVDTLVGTYLRLGQGRNHALDLLPILKHLSPERVVSAEPQMAHKSARPAWHYRLPDCRIDDPDWSIALEWARWCAIERIAQDDRLVGALGQAWRDYRRRPLPIPGRWAAVSAEILDRADVLP